MAGRLPIHEIATRVFEGLEAGLTTDQIAADCGIQYATLYYRLDYGEEYDLLKDLDDRRVAEGLPQRVISTEHRRELRLARKARKLAG